MFRKKTKLYKLFSFLLTLVLLVLSFSSASFMPSVQEVFAQEVNHALTGTPSHANQQAYKNNYLVWTWQDAKLNDGSIADVAHGVVVSDGARYQTWASFDSIITWGAPIAQLDKIEIVVGLYMNEVIRLIAYVDTGAGWQQVGDTGVFQPTTAPYTQSFTTGAPWYNVQRIKVYSWSLCAPWSYVDYRLFEIRAFGPVASFQDIGLRMQTPDGIVSIAAEIGVPTSPLRIAKDGVVYGIVLVNPDDANDSGIRIRLASGETKALRKL